MALQKRKWFSFLALSNLYVALHYGCQLETRCRVVEVTKDLRQGVWKVTAEKRDVKGGNLSTLFLRARKVINCAGNYSDEIDHFVPRTIDEGKPFTIQPGRHSVVFLSNFSQSFYENSYIWYKSISCTTCITHDMGYK